MPNGRSFRGSGAACEPGTYAHGLVTLWMGGCSSVPGLALWGHPGMTFYESAETGPSLRWDDCERHTGASGWWGSGGSSTRIGSPAWTSPAVSTTAMMPALRMRLPFWSRSKVAPISPGWMRSS